MRTSKIPRDLISNISDYRSREQLSRAIDRYVARDRETRDDSPTPFGLRSPTLSRRIEIPEYPQERRRRVLSMRRKRLGFVDAARFPGLFSLRTRRDDVAGERNVRHEKTRLYSRHATGLETCTRESLDERGRSEEDPTREKMDTCVCARGDVIIYLLIISSRFTWGTGDRAELCSDI